MEPRAEKAMGRHQADLPAAAGVRVRPPSWRQRLRARLRNEYEEDGVFRPVRLPFWADLATSAAKESPRGRVNWQHPGLEIGPASGQIEPVTLNFLRTLCGLRGVTPPLTCTNASIHTLKRNSTTSPSAIT